MACLNTSLSLPGAVARVTVAIRAQTTTESRFRTRTKGAPENVPIAESGAPAVGTRPSVPARVPGKVAD